jgi:hypothetical protein
MSGSLVSSSPSGPRYVFGCESFSLLAAESVSAVVLAKRDGVYAGVERVHSGRKARVCEASTSGRVSEARAMKEQSRPRDHRRLLDSD